MSQTTKKDQDAAMDYLKEKDFIFSENLEIAGNAFIAGCRPGRADQAKNTREQLLGMLRSHFSAKQYPGIWQAVDLLENEMSSMKRKDEEQSND